MKTTISLPRWDDNDEYRRPVELTLERTSRGSVPVIRISEGKKRTISKVELDAVALRAMLSLLEDF